MSLQEIRHMPLSRMTLEQQLELSLSNFMVDLRQEANRAKASGLYGYLDTSMRYLRGRIDGLYYGTSSILIFQDHAAFERISSLFDAARNESSFLMGAYQTGGEQ